MNAAGLAYFHARLADYDGRPVRLLARHAYPLWRAAVKFCGEADVNHACRVGFFYCTRVFEPKYGFQFSTLATHWVRRETRELLNGPRRWKDGMQRGDLRHWAAFVRLDVPCDDGGGTLARNLLPAREQSDPLPVELADGERKVNEWLSRLDPRRRRAVQGHLIEEKTLDEVGRELGVTRERVRQLVNDAKDKLKIIIHRGCEFGGDN